MPLPAPRTDEDERDFMDRCMGDESVQSEFGPMEQRVAVCMNQWRRGEKAAPDGRESIAVPMEIKSLEVEKRQFTGLCSTWDIDLDGDRVEPGCFLKSIAEFIATKDDRKRRKRVPLLNRHQSHDVTQHVLGHAVDLQETSEGLLGTFYVDDTRTGEDAWRLIKSGSVGALSIGFLPLSTTKEKARDASGKERQVRVIKEVKLVEVSLVPFPANEGALIDLASVKDALAARDLSDADREALEKAQRVIATRLANIQADGVAETEGSTGEPEDLGTPPPIVEVEAKMRVLAKQRDEALAQRDWRRAENLDERVRGCELKLTRKQKEYARLRAEIDQLTADVETSQKALDEAIAAREWDDAGPLERHIAATEAKLERKRAAYMAESRRPDVLMPDAPDRLDVESRVARLMFRSAS